MIVVVSHRLRWGVLMVLPVDGLLVFNPNLFGYLSRLLLGVHVEGLFTKWALKNAVRAIEYLINVLFTKGSPRWGFGN